MTPEIMGVEVNVNVWGGACLLSVVVVAELLWHSVSEVFHGNSYSYSYIKPPLSSKT